MILAELEWGTVAELLAAVVGGVALLLAVTEPSRRRKEQARHRLREFEEALRLAATDVAGLLRYVENIEPDTAGDWPRLEMVSLRALLPFLSSLSEECADALLAVSYTLAGYNAVAPAADFAPGYDPELKKAANVRVRRRLAFLKNDLGQLQPILERESAT